MLRSLLLSASLLSLSAGSYADLIKGELDAVPESINNYYWGDGINDLYQGWSISYFDYSGWFYSSEYPSSNADVFVYKGLTDVTQIDDASLFDYQSTGAYQASEGDTVFFRGTNGMYGAWTIDDIFGYTGEYPYGYLDGTWYFLDDGSADFSIGASQVIEVTLNEDEDFFVPMRGGRVNYDVALSKFEPGTQLKQWSVITLPNGDSFPIDPLRTLNEIDINGELRLENSFFFIPAWLDNGEYLLTWYVFDVGTFSQHTGTMSFRKGREL